MCDSIHFHMYMYGTSNIVVAWDIFKVPHRMGKSSGRNVHVYKWSKEVDALSKEARDGLKMTGMSNNYVHIRN